MVDNRLFPEEGWWNRAKARVTGTGATANQLFGGPVDPWAVMVAGNPVGTSEIPVTVSEAGPIDALVGFIKDRPVRESDLMSAMRIADFAGTLGGKNSLTFPHDKLRFAEKMERAGARPETIWKGYGLMRDKAGNWRYEIPDEGMRLWVDAGYPAGKDQVGFFARDAALEPSTYTTVKFGPTTKISDVMEHPELFRAYPHLANTPLRHMPLFSQADGMYIPDSRTVALAGNRLDTLPKVMAHELQHGIQHFEEVPIGGNPQQFLPKTFAKDQQDFELLRKKFEDALTRTGRPSTDLYELPYLATTNSARAKRIMGLIQQDDPEFYKLLQDYAKKELKLREQKNTAYDAYRSLAGEQEAEAVANRIHLDRRGRVEIPFWNDFTVPLENQLLGDVLPW